MKRGFFCGRHKLEKSGFLINTLKQVQLFKEASRRAMKIFFVSDGSEGADERLFRKLLLQVVIVAAIVHVAFASVFYMNHVSLLAGVNVVSVIFYSLVFMLMKAGVHQVVIWTLVAIELMGHAVLAVYLIGWDSGFHFYVMLIPPVMMLSPVRTVSIKALLVLIMITFYILMDYSLRNAVPAFEVPSVVLNGLHYFNLLSVLLLMVFLTGLYYRLVASSQKKLEKMATTDSLTGLHNRRSLEQAAASAIENHKRNGVALSVLLCDLDKFKQVNDEYGHQVGDQVLKAFSALITDVIRSGDFAARWGGEEFLLLLPTTKAEVAIIVAERIRQQFEQLVVVGALDDLRVTVTIGISEFYAGDTFDHLVARADEALYRGKNSGRNQVILSFPPSVPSPPVPSA
jgi:diguanylate cyclase (GGDEF)-like protein